MLQEETAGRRRRRAVHLPLRWWRFRSWREARWRDRTVITPVRSTVLVTAPRGAWMGASDPLMLPDTMSFPGDDVCKGWGIHYYGDIAYYIVLTELWLDSAIDVGMLV